MRMVEREADLEEALTSAQREAKSAFGDDRFLIEKYVTKARHVEVQIFGDGTGNVVHMFERDCSVQRRHQKVIEEAPAPGLDAATREAMGAAAVAAARAVGYVGAGTVEFLYDGREFYFLEMNTRLQVEHPVTEMITGLDLVEWQLRVADGEPLPLEQSQITQRGHAVEARLYAEDPDRGFLPSTGRIERLRFPAHLEHVRVDTGVREGDEVSIHYDPMVAKVIAWGADRLEAIDRLRAALEATDVDGVRTNTRFLWEILGHEAVRAGDVSTRLLETGLPASGPSETDTRSAWLVGGAIGAHLGLGATGLTEAPSMPWGQRGGFRLNAPATVRVALALGGERRWLRLRPAGPDMEIELDGRMHLLERCELAPGRIRGRLDGQPFEARYEPRHDGFVMRRDCLTFDFAEDTGAEHHASAEHEGHLRSPMPGLVLDVRARPGERVAGGAVLVVLEAMKMEHSLSAPWDGTVSAVAVKPGDRVEEGVELVVLEPLPDESLREPANTK
jgi:3-methylcrotonyl-CoA carboxylase alpha subunit